jgi:hypothetical protein
MKISKSLESPVGTVSFVGELEGVELDMVIQLGLLTLMARGAIKTEIVPDKGEQH